MEIKIEISEATISRFSTVTLSYMDDKGNNRNADLQVDFLPLFDFAKDTSSTRFDFFLISALVYGIDNVINRKNYSVDGWAREFEVTFPVKNISRWSGNEQLLSDLLKFLTGDYWTISFEDLNVTDLFLEKKGRWSKNIPSYVYPEIVKVSLFSGGLDSLIGVIDILHNLNINEKILLVSHFDSNSVGPNSDQVALHEILSKNFADKVYWIQSTVTLDRKDSNGNYLELEDSYRSRSLLFMGIAIYMFNDLIQTTELIIPENGTISLNYPLTPSRVSSLSTRTTHPYVLTLIQKLITNVIKNISVTNPYSLKTKGEMVLGCLDYDVLNLTYCRSVSCGKRGGKHIGQ
ncbi:MAG: hypothetical protein IPN43_10915 [Chitinophagaceae bacterium]|nr:hypothetical protein [Chitinophagaceae bacterium]